VKVILAEYAGYCYGVERAFNMVQIAAGETGDSITTLGPLIHNRQAIEALHKEFKVSRADSLNDIKNGTVVIRTHGEPPQVTLRAGEKGLDILDATCPFVRAAQKMASKLVKDGYTLVILGEKNHPEVIGVAAHAGSAHTVVVEEPEEITGHLPIARAGIIVQTTQQLSKLEKLVTLILPHSKEMEIHNTICYATFDRQEAARRLAAEVDIIVVVGGRDSGNTRRLVEVCRDEGAQVLHVETADELELQDFTNHETAGVTAGASTPDFVIEDVVAKLKSF